MIKEFWNSREPREKTLMSVALVLTLAVMLWQFACIPASQYKMRAERAFTTASGDLGYVRQSTRQISARRNPGSASTPLQSVVVDVANIYGLSISRIEPASDGGLTLWFESEAPATLFAWLKDLDDNHGVTVGKASIRLVQDGGNVSANLYVNRGG